MLLTWLDRPRKRRGRAAAGRASGAKRRAGRVLSSATANTIEALEGRVLLSAPTQFYTTGIGGGGALYTPSLSPFNTNEIWLATDMSEVFHTTNMGASWTYPNFNQIEGDPSVDVQYTSNPNILYSINSVYIYPNGGPDHLSESTNDGTTWTNLAGWSLSDAAYNLYVNPSTTTEMVAADASSLYFSSNGGTTFTTKYTAATAGTLFCAGTFFNGSNIYIGTNQGLIESTNGGTSFSVASVGGIPSGQAMLSFAGAASGSTTRFFCVTVPSSDLSPGVSNYSVATDYTGIYSLTLGNADWAAASTGISSTDYPDFISMTAGDINDVYAAGTNSVDHPTVYKSTNAGASWTDVFNATNNVNINTAWEGQGGDNNWGFGGVAFGLEVSPVNVNIAVMSDEDGAYDTTNGGTTWTQMFVNPADSNPAGQDTPKHKYYQAVGMNQTSVWNLTWSSPTNMFASFTDLTGIHSTDGGITWNFPNYGSVLQNTIYQTVVGPTGIMYAADSSIHDLFQSDRLENSQIDSGTGAVIMSTDGGEDWTMLHNFGMPVDDIILDPNVANRAYALVVNSTKGGIFVTNDLSDGANSVWTQLTDPPRTTGHPWDMQILNDGTLVVSYSGTLSGSTFTKTSGVFYSTNAGTSWVDASAPDMDYYTMDVVIDPQDPTQDTWYACVANGWGGNGNNLGGIYKTTNRGKTWTQIFSQDGVNSLTINAATHEMYVATVTSGLWYSSNANAATPTFSEVTSYPFHEPMRIFIDPYNTNEIWTTSFGGGLMVGYTTPANVAGVDVFYAGSSFDGSEAAPNANDDNAIATDKTPLLPGQTATFANYTSYIDGINGIMVDLADAPPATLSLSDFSFTVGNNSTLSSWTTAPAPTSMVVTPGGGVNDSTRVEFVWANNAIENEWLQITVNADSDTGLASPDIFYYGNSIGSTGAANPSSGRVTPADVTAVESNVGPGAVGITNPYDFTRAGRVSPADVTIAESSVAPSGLQLISPPAAPAVIPAALPSVQPATALPTAPASTPALLKPPVTPAATPVPTLIPVPVTTAPGDTTAVPQLAVNVFWPASIKWLGGNAWDAATSDLKPWETATYWGSDFLP